MSLRATRQPNNWFEPIAGASSVSQDRESMIWITFLRRSTHK
jgi:hypothetical protein